MYVVHVMMYIIIHTCPSQLFRLKSSSLLDKLSSGEVGVCNTTDSSQFVSLEQFDYQNRKLGCLLQQALDKTNFLGVTVSVCVCECECVCVCVWESL